MNQKKKKIFIFLPDGVGLRNFAFTNFYELGKANRHDITFWNNTIFPLKDKFNFKEIKVVQREINPLTDIYKRVRKELELKQNYKNFKNKVYLSYKFPQSYKTLKSGIKSILVSYLVKRYNSKRGLAYVRNKINSLERKSEYYKKVKSQLQEVKPNFIFCTNQRPLLGISPILAAKDIGIPTATFIFSWDNLPKGTLVIETDYYFVWSDFMRDELIKYYPFIKPNQIKVTGTPQFEIHFDKSLIIDKIIFFKKYNLENNKKYICFSGDDITTSPYDQYYLRDLAISIRKLNKVGNNLGIIFRRCPVDTSDRYDSIIDEFKDEIISINPIWNAFGDNWNQIMPTPDDNSLLTNIVHHTEAVINVGSSMVFDFVCHNKPCIYINYNTDEVNIEKWNISKIYEYIHFKSMPSKTPVFWVNSKDSIQEVIDDTLNNSDEVVNNAKEWFKIINQDPPELASERIWDSINKIVTCT